MQADRSRAHVNMKGEIPRSIKNVNLRMTHNKKRMIELQFALHMPMGTINCKFLVSGFFVLTTSRIIQEEDSFHRTQFFITAMIKYIHLQIVCV